MSDEKYTTLRTADDVTDEIKKLALDIADGWYADTRIEWDDVWDRMDGRELEDGTYLDLPELDNPAMRAIKSYVRNDRKAG